MENWKEVNKEDILIPTQKKEVINNRNLIQKIEAILSSHELQEKYSTRLTNQSLLVIERLIKTKPEFFRVVESNLVRNINDNKLRAEDVPYIISIVSQLYTLLVTINIDQQNESPVEVCGNILKFLFSVAVRESLIKIEDETEAILLLLCCDNIIESCVKLLHLKPQKNMYHPTIEPRIAPVVPPPKKSGCC
jgi:hypothetical protein